MLSNTINLKLIDAGPKETKENKIRNPYQNTIESNLTYVQGGIKKGFGALKGLAKRTGFSVPT